VTVMPATAIVPVATIATVTLADRRAEAGPESFDRVRCDRVPLERVPVDRVLVDRVPGERVVPARRPVGADETPSARGRAGLPPSARAPAAGEDGASPPARGSRGDRSAGPTVGVLRMTAFPRRLRGELSGSGLGRPGRNGDDPFAASPQGRPD
jgi:hypothetical protein